MVRSHTWKKDCENCSYNDGTYCRAYKKTIEDLKKKHICSWFYRQELNIGTTTGN